MKTTRFLFGGLLLLATSFYSFAQTEAVTNPTVSSLDRVNSEEARAKLQWLKKYDTNGNGKIDVEERNGYVRERSLFYRTKRAERAKENFTKADVNKDGRVDVRERKAVEEEHERLGRAVRKPKNQSSDNKGEGQTQSEKNVLARGLGKKSSTSSEPGPR